jgi:hypothetical protein
MVLALSDSRDQQGSTAPGGDCFIPPVEITLMLLLQQPVNRKTT